MMPVRPVRAALLLLALVAVSGLTGAVIGHRLARTAYERRGDMELWNEYALDYVDRGVSLTPAQRTAIKGRIDAAVLTLKGIRQDTTIRSSAVMRQLLEQVDLELNAEQRAAFQRLKPPAEAVNSLDVLKVERPQR